MGEFTYYPIEEADFTEIMGDAPSNWYIKSILEVNALQQITILKRANCLPTTLMATTPVVMPLNSAKVILLEKNIYHSSKRSSLMLNLRTKVSVM